MNVRLALWLFAALLGSAGSAGAQEPTTPSQHPIEQRLDELAKVDQEIADAKQQLAVTKRWRDRWQLQTRIKELEAAQQRLLQDIEQFVGPPSPAVQPEPPIPLEQQLKTQQRHHDAILESDVTQRLPGN